MFLDPDKLQQSTPAEVLDAAARAHLGVDHRFLKALLDRKEETLAAAVAFGERDRSVDRLDIAAELIALFRHWKAPEGIPFYIRYIKEDPENLPDEVVVGLVELGRASLDPLIELYEELEEEESGEVAFVLANLHIHDPRVLQILLDRMDYDLADSALLLGIYHDPAAIPALEEALANLDDGDVEIKKELAEVIANLSEPQPSPEPLEAEPFDIWSLYPEQDDLPVDALEDGERRELLTHPSAEIRAIAAHSFFNQPLSEQERAALLTMAKTDPVPEVRARAWESLIDATEDTEVVESMLQALRSPQTPVEERCGLVVGLAPETDRNEVRQQITDLYKLPEGRAKALEAMWRSIHPSFRDYFAKHLDDNDVEVRRSALWGVGYYGLKSELERVRKIFDDEELRSDALFSYALALGEVSRGRIKGLLTRIEKDAGGLSQMEEELVKAALDERLILAGKEPFFRQPED